MSITTRNLRFILIAVIAALALTLCLTPAGIRLTGIYAYFCLGCGGIGAVSSDWVSRWLHNKAYAPDWLEYFASYAVFFIANAASFLLFLWVAWAAVRGIAKSVARVRPHIEPKTR